MKWHIMEGIRWTATLLLGLVLLGGWLVPVQGQEPRARSRIQASDLAEADRLNEQIVKLLDKGQYGLALPLAERALAIREQALGPQHPDVATSLINLAELYRAMGNYGPVESLLQRALAIREQSLGPQHPEVAFTLNNLAARYEAAGEYHRAELLYQRALAIYEQALGPQHPRGATVLANLAGLYQTTGDIPRAVAFMTRSHAIREHYLGLILATGAETQKRAYLAMLTNETHATVSFHVQGAPTDLSARRAALTTVLQRKGRVLDAMADALQAVRRRLEPEDQALLTQLAALRAQLATLVLRGPGPQPPAQHQEKIAALEAQAEPLEAALSARSAAFRAEAQPVTLAQVQAAIPEGLALVELVWYRPLRPRAAPRAEQWGPPRYAAYILHRRGEPAWVDLGEADPIDRSVTTLRRALSVPNSTDVRAHARVLDERVMRPLRPLLGQTRHLLLAPDGALSLLPLGTLMDEDGRYLVERFTFTYLTSGRDLLWLQGIRPRPQGALVVANPDFGGRPRAPILPESHAGPAAQRSVDLAGLRFGPLPGTKGEAVALARLLPGATILTEGAATEAALKQAHAPRILHVATHGFFLADQPKAPEVTRGVELLATEGPLSPPGPWRENPLIRSGLALAGANPRQSGAEDGILTALEAVGLDLWGTQLVVLSACETGVGEVHNGEGVYGLRRALVLAGAESQVMSLWKVADEATREFMVAYYGRLIKGEGRAAALRQVQLALLAQPERSHPFYWASFIPSGAWGPLDGLTAAGKTQKR